LGETEIETEKRRNKNRDAKLSKTRERGKAERTSKLGEKRFGITN
jgi:hypothetical protein